MLRRDGGKAAAAQGACGSDAEMPSLATLGFGNGSKIAGCLGAGRAMTAVTAENTAILDGQRVGFVKDKGFRDNMIELDDFTRNVESAAFATDVAVRIHGTFDHGDLLGAGKFATSVHQAASI